MVAQQLDAGFSAAVQQAGDQALAERHLTGRLPAFHHREGWRAAGHQAELHDLRVGEYGLEERRRPEQVVRVAEITQTDRLDLQIAPARPRPPGASANESGASIGVKRMGVCRSRNRTISGAARTNAAAIAGDRPCVRPSTYVSASSGLSAVWWLPGAHTCPPETAVAPPPLRAALQHGHRRAGHRRGERRAKAGRAGTNNNDRGLFEHVRKVAREPVYTPPSCRVMAGASSDGIRIHSTG